MKTVGIADLKARLSEHLRAVKRGRSLTVVDRDRPVALLTPIEGATIEIRKAIRRPVDLGKVPPMKRRTNSLAALLDDRRRR